MGPRIHSLIYIQWAHSYENFSNGMGGGGGKIGA
jgi:hypothetical protein